MGRPRSVLLVHRPSVEARISTVEGSGFWGLVRDPWVRLATRMLDKLSLGS